MRAIDAFLDGILDYAGLFPPAELDLRTALHNYAHYRNHPHSRLLGRFVLPLNQWNGEETPDRLTLVARGEGVRLPKLTAAVEAVEVAGSLAEPAPVRVFHEIDWRSDFDERMAELENRPLTGVKLRTGGTTAGAFPPPRVVAEFLTAASRRRLPVKFTAGLHAPVPNRDTATGAQAHGFLNVFAAAFLAFQHDADMETLTSLLADAGYDDFRFEEKEFHCGGFAFPAEVIRELRRDWLPGFGSCSFLEPVEHLAHHGLL